MHAVIFKGGGYRNINDCSGSTLVCFALQAFLPEELETCLAWSMAAQGKYKHLHSFYRNVIVAGSAYISSSATSPFLL